MDIFNNPLTLCASLIALTAATSSIHDIGILTLGPPQSCLSSLCTPRAHLLFLF
jgi:hypothetical protein